MINLIRKRHPGEGWLVFTELGDRPGYYANRRADAFALGVWASTKYETHLYEEKCSREDLKKELKDPTKMQALGKYARYRWLVVSDEKITDGLVIPDVWGILTPSTRGGQEILRVVRKAPPLKATPIDPLFTMSMVRNALKGWVSKVDHDAMLAELAEVRASKRLPSPEIVDEKVAELTHKLQRYEQQVAAFEEASGVKLDLSGYQAGRLGKVFKAVLDMQDRGSAVDGLRQHVAHFSEVAEELLRRATNMAESAAFLRQRLGLDAVDHDELCKKKQGWGRKCSCGKIPLTQLEQLLADAQVPIIEE